MPWIERVSSSGLGSRRWAADEWVKPTPCDEWDVRYLVAHVVGGNRFASSVLSGASAQAAMGSVMSHASARVGAAGRLRHVGGG